MLFQFQLRSFFVNVPTYFRSLSPQKRVRLRKLKGNLWESIDADPQFLFPAPWRRPSILTLILEGGDDFIEPKLYFDWGDGFHEFESVTFGSMQTAVICLHFGDTRGLRKIRLDPAERRATFSFRSVLNTEGNGALDWAQHHVEVACAKGRVALLQNIDMQEYATPARGRPMGMKRRPRNTQEHFMRTVEILMNPLILDRLEIA